MPNNHLVVVASDVDMRARVSLSRATMDEDFVLVAENLDKLLPLRGWPLR